MDISSKYQKLTPIEHILKRPGMYIGGVDKIEQDVFILNDQDKDKISIENKTVVYSPGLYKIFDEIIVNAYDQSLRDDTLTKIKVSIDKQKNQLIIENDGKGIPVVIHPKYKIYIPELIFGHLLTSTSFNEMKEKHEKITGGIHGLGAKLTAIFSSYFKIEVGDPKNKKKFSQTYKKNLSDKSKPIISNYNQNNGYVKITFRPDLTYFKYGELDNDLVNLMKRRVYDLCALTEKIKIYLNNERININNFNDYTKLFYKDENISRLYDDCSEGRWKYIVAPAPSRISKTNSISFVNGIYTMQGGRHVDYIIKKIIKGLKEIIYKKFKKSIPDQFIRNNIFLFLICSIEEPVFSSQTKDELMTPVSKFGSTCEISDNYIKKIYTKLNFQEIVQVYVSQTEKQDLTKLKVKKKSTVGIAKLNDANYAGTTKAYMCTLILTEGDSAKTMAISGLSVINKANNYYGVFPLKGKLLNVREASHEQILNNEEFINLRKIVGLQIGKKYTKEDISDLRYGQIVLMMDADVDGSHIKGLFINIIDYYWPSLLKIDGFIKIFITPSIKVTLKQKILSFYTQRDYEEWTKKIGEKELVKWKIKYYKGLGTSTSQEAKEYFSNLENNIITLIWDDKSKDAIELAFKKDKADERKIWLQKYDSNQVVNHNKKVLSYYNFINKELKHFSIYDNVRSIPNIMDGFKPSHRKIIYAAFKRNLTKEIKVAQLVGYIGEHTAYHHGEISLAKTIISLCQNFVGSNNINLLKPIGQFGTRLMGGKDHSSPRYIFTQLDEIARIIFNKDDDELLTFLNEEGFQIEPEYYVPIVPMVLINGAEGIGTGYSTYIPKFNPLDIINNLKNKLEKGDKFKDMTPWYKGYTGKISRIDKNVYESKGSINIDKDKVIITELPITYWTENYKSFLEKNITDRFMNNSTESTVEFIIKKKYIEHIKLLDIDKKFSMTNRINLTNMYLYDPNRQIKKYSSVKDILKDFYEIRLQYYDKRKKLLLDKLQQLLNILESKIKFIDAILNKKLVLYNLKKDKIIEILKNNKFYLIKNELPFDYLIKMSFYSFSKEKIEELQKLFKEKKKLYKEIKDKTIARMYLDDLQKLQNLLQQKKN